jgi:hypothetical protein
MSVLLLTTELVIPELVTAQGYDPPTPWADFTITSVWTTPTAPSERDLVIFHARVEILLNAAFRPQWVGVRCLLDGQVWHEEPVLVSTTPIEVHSQRPWNATLGWHEVIWDVDRGDEYYDLLASNNAMGHQFVVESQNESFDFAISSSPTYLAATPAEPASYGISIYSGRERAEAVELVLQDAPQLMRYSFQPSSGNSTFLSKLSITFDSVSEGIYYLTVNASGQTRTHAITLVFLVQSAPKQNSSISLSIAPRLLTLGEIATIHGAITPPRSAVVTLTYTRPDDMTQTTYLTAQKDGSFTHTFMPDARGNWTISTSWEGDANYLGSSSEPIRVQVDGMRPSPSAELLIRLQATPPPILNMIAVLLFLILLLILVCALILVGV